MPRVEGPEMKSQMPGPPYQPAHTAETSTPVSADARFTISAYSSVKSAGSQQLSMQVSKPSSRSWRIFGATSSPSVIKTPNFIG